MSGDGLPDVIRGGNFTLEVRDGRLHTRVYKRVDTDLAAGAEFAHKLADVLIAMVERPRTEVSYALVDVSQAPAIAGPQTRQSIGRFLSRWERAARPMLFVVGAEAIKQVQFHGIVHAHAPNWGRVTLTVAEAETEARKMIKRPGSSPRGSGGAR